MFVEDGGRTEAALLDIVDYRILRAVMHDLAHQPEIDAGAGLPDDALSAPPQSQEQFNHVLASYLAGAISPERAAELLDLPLDALRNRFDRLDVPRRTGPSTLDEARTDARTASSWARVG